MKNYLSDYKQQFSFQYVRNLYNKKWNHARFQFQYSHQWFYDDDDNDGNVNKTSIIIKY